MLAYKEEGVERDMPGNGEVNRECGAYKTLCCDVEVEIHEGSQFPDCPNHPNLPTIWKRVKSEEQPAQDRRNAAA
jgi:hypothetical protein